MIAESVSKLICDGLAEAGIDLVVCLPDSWMNIVIGPLSTDPRFKFVRVTNEGEGVAICAGAWLGGRKPALMMENTGFLVSAYAIETVCAKYGIPVLLVMGYRGAFDDPVWWVASLGEKMPNLLKSMKVRYKVVAERSEIKTALRQGWNLSSTVQYPTAVLLTRSVMK